MFKAPIRDGLVPSSLQLPQGPWATVLQALCAHFPQIAASEWQSRMARGLVLDDLGQPLNQASVYTAGARIHYYREVQAEPVIPFQETILHVDEHLVVADKPHFLPVTPTGRYVQQTLLTRLIQRLDNPHLVPLHRIDRDTAGLVLFSAKPESRARYQALFRERAIHKTYQALAPALPGLVFPMVRKTRLEAGAPFFLMREVAGTANTETEIQVLEAEGPRWRYALSPVTGKKHQLRVHMAALGAGIINDRFYPTLRQQDEDDPAQPLQLLAQQLAFADPLTGAAMQFDSQQTLQA